MEGPPVTRPESGPDDPAAEVQGETCVAGAIEGFDPEMNVICFLVADVQGDAAAIGRTP